MGLLYVALIVTVAYWYMDHVKRNTPAEQDGGLVREERGLVPFFILLNPIINGLVFLSRLEK